MAQQVKERPLGLLRPGINPDVVMMLCTAGHVDHGKTQLVKLLTGCNTDRLKAEQERGLTIELGFAPCYLGDNLCVGIVDVPGHEKFIKNMVAGVSGIDMTVLVIAADDGVMPQTIEHVQIMEMLGVRRGLVALTKIDLAPPERVEEVREEISEFLQGTFLEGALICPVSSETGEGFFEFYDQLVNQINATVRKRRYGVFRMPVERVFVRPGFGVVLTGIPVDGAVKNGDEVELMPGNRRGRVRGIQRFLRGAREGGYGQCLALNIPELGKPAPERGQVVCAPGYLRARTVFYARIRVVSDAAKPLRNGEEVKLHTGTIETSAKVYLIEKAELARGESGYATLVTPDPIAAAPRDRLILRRASPAATIAGGEIRLIGAEGERLRKKQALERLTFLESLTGGFDPDSDERVDNTIAAFLRMEHPLGTSDREISQGTFLTQAVVDAGLARLQRTGLVRELSPRFFIHADSYATCLADAERRLKNLSTAPDALSVPIAQVKVSLGWPDPLWERVEADLAEKEVIRAKDGKYLLESAVKALDDQDRQLLERILRIYEAQGFHSPRPEELPGLLAAPPDRVARLLNYLCHNAQLVRIAKNVVLAYTWLKKAQELVVGEIMVKGVLDSGDFKHVIGSTRKYALAILDYLDANHITVRAGNERRLAPNYRKNLK